VRFKDLLGRSSKPEQEPPNGRLITPASGPAPSPSAADIREEQRARPASPERPAVPPPANPPVGAPPSNLPVADRFAMVLAVEQGETTLPPPPAGDRDTALSDEDLDRLARRVAEHLASSPLATDVQRIVAEVSERLVREEIARIRKAAESR
jgi:transglutaminase-like putative cysteine protease